ncbi:MAG TPA: ParB N-terminal domain-containing protein, partial [Nevskiaceae bacterium]|nr:ParB N-terminal domain-containing protein [Nevskiaceae bacterium]
MQTQQAIPLNKLFLSPLNQRQTVEGDDVSDLLPLIRSQGLLQRLVVVPPAGKEKRFGVVAGGRRLLCLHTLARSGEIGKKAEIDCLVIPAETGIAASIAENTARKNLHPADEFLAFRALVESGTSVEDVAATFGVTPLVVQRRLKLCTVSPRLIDAWRADEVSLDQLMALAITDDTSAQEAAWFEAPDWDRQPHAIRRKLTAGEPDAATDRRVAYVGLDTYVAAGGTLRCDLFAEHGGYILDVPLLDRLVREKMEAQADALRAEGWGAVHLVSSGNGINLDFECVRLRPSKRDATEAEVAETAQLRTRLDEIDTKLDAEEDEESIDAQALYDERDRIDERLEDLEDGRLEYTPEQMSAAGVVLALDHDGGVRCERGVVPRTEATKHLGDVDDDTRPQRVKPERGVHSEKLVQALSAHRSAALQAVLADNPRFALVGLLATMVPRVFGSWNRDSGLRITLSPSVDELKRKAEDLVESKALQRLSDIHTDWNTRLSVGDASGDDEDQGASDPTIDWLVAQDMETLLSLLAYCVATSVDLTVARESTVKARAFTKAVGLDMADWWEATASGYFAHVSKARTLAVVKEACATPPSGL